MSKMTMQRTKEEASGSANSLDRAIGYLNAALTELDQAHAHAKAADPLLTSLNEKAIYDALSEMLTSKAKGPKQVISLIDWIRRLRDCRASRAGFSFDE